MRGLPFSNGPGRVSLDIEGISGNRALQNASIQPTLTRQLGNRCHCNVAPVNLEKFAQRGARVAASKAVGAERKVWTADVGGDQLWLGTNIIS